MPKDDAVYPSNFAFGSGKSQYYLDAEQFVPINRIVREKAFDFSNATHRDLMAECFKFQKSNTLRVSMELTDKDPRFVKPDTSTDEEPTELPGLQSFWRDRRLTEMLKQAVFKGRKHGTVIYYPINPKTQPAYTTAPPWLMFAGAEVAEHVDKRDAWGNPTSFHITPKNQGIEPFDVSISECIFYDPNCTEDFAGIPEGSDIWDDMLDYIFIVDAMLGFDQRMGNGFLILPIDASMSPEDEKVVEGRIKHIRTSSGLTVRELPKSEGNLSPPTWLNASGQTPFVDHLEKLEQGFAQSLKFPLRWLQGDQEGAMESSGKDRDQANCQLKKIFRQWIPFIKRILLFHKQISAFDEIEVLMGDDIEVSDLEKAQMDQVRTQTIAAKAWLDVNEKRTLDGYGPATPELTDQINSANKIGIDWGLGNSPVNNDSPANSPPQKATTKADAIVDFITQQSINECADFLGVSPATISRIRAKFDDESTPRLHDDDVSFKCDSVADNVFCSEGIILSPGELQYEDSKLIDVRSPDAIREWFNSNTPKEFNIGINPDDSHNSHIPLEVLREESIGTVKAIGLNQDGSVRGEVKIDLQKVDERLGSSNWVREYIANQKDLPASVALYSRDRVLDRKRLNTNLDVRSFVLTRHPRNAKTTFSAVDKPL